MKKIILLCLFFLSFFVLCACGQNGPLYLPAGDQPVDQTFIVRN